MRRIGAEQALRQPSAKRDAVPDAKPVAASQPCRTRANRRIPNLPIVVVLIACEKGMLSAWQQEVARGFSVPMQFSNEHRRRSAPELFPVLPGRNRGYALRALFVRRAISRTYGIRRFSTCSIRRFGT